MIVIEFENLKLQLISAADLEMIREWRNAPHVAEFMEYQEEITEEAQMAWFKSIQNKEHLYLKILVNETPIGLLNLKNIDWKNKNAEAGVFVGRDDFRGTITPILSIFVLMKTVFDYFGFEQLQAKISNKNEQAIRFNKELGYTLQEKMNEGFDQYICTKSSFSSPNSSISKIQELFKKHGQIKIYVDKESSWILPYLNMDEHGFLLVEE